MENVRPLSEAFQKLSRALRPRYPDYSDYTVVALDDRSRDSLHFFLHRNLGGLLPKVSTWEEYKKNALRQNTGKRVLEEDEAFLRFHLFRVSRSKDAFPEESAQIFSFQKLLSRFSVTQEELLKADHRLSEEQRSRVLGFFQLREDFRSRLSAEGACYLPFEEEVLRGVVPGEKEYFVGLPLLTPAHETFLGKIPPDRLFLPEAVFGPFFPNQPPPYESAYALALRYGLPINREETKRIEFSEVKDRPSLASLVATEVDRFLRVLKEEGGDAADQMAVLLLDEELSFYLWRLLFEPLGERVNFSPWLPFRNFSVSKTLLNAVDRGENLAETRENLIKEMRASWGALDMGERAACEGGIALCDSLERWREEIKNDTIWKPLARYFIQAKKLHLTGSRQAPIQVLGLGEAGGSVFFRALVLPMDRDLFPHKPFRGPFLNAIHVPRIYRAQFEANDLLLRQFFSLCRSIHLVARYDTRRGHAPSAHFAFLAAEFGREPEERYLKPVPFTTGRPTPKLPNTDQTREFFRTFTWSFHSLKLFFSCPYAFLLRYKEELPTPATLEDPEEAVNLRIGNVLHAWASNLQNHKPAAKNWKECFETTWKEKVGTDGEPGEEYFTLHEIYKPLVLAYLEDIAQEELQSGTLLLLDDRVSRREETLKASFGTGSGVYQVKGRLDRVQPYKGKTFVLDLKYKTAENVRLPRGGLRNYLETRGELHNGFQLALYVYLLLNNDRQAPQNLGAGFFALKEMEPGQRLIELPDEEVRDIGPLMEFLSRELTARLELGEFQPNHKSDQCRFCAYQPLCGHPDGLKGEARW